MTTPLDNGTLLFDMDGSVRSASPAAVRILNASPHTFAAEADQVLESVYVAVRGFEELPAHAAAAAHEDAQPLRLWVTQGIAHLQQAAHKANALRGTLLLPNGRRAWCKLDVLYSTAASGDALLTEAASLAVWPIPNPGEAVSSASDHRGASFQQERRLQSSEAKYRLLAENASDVIWTMDNALNLTYVSPAVRRMHGYTPEEARDMDWTAFVKPSSHPVVRSVLERRRHFDAEGTPSKPLRLELEQLRRDGTPIWTEVIVTPLFNDDGTRLGYLGITRNISEKKQALTALTQFVQRTQVLHHLGRTMLDMAGTSADEIAALALDHLRQLVPHVRSSVVVFDSERDAGTIIAAHTPHPTDLEPGRRLPLSFFSQNERAVSSQVHYVEDWEAAEPSSPRKTKLMQLGVRASLSAPLVVEGRRVGTLNVGAAQPRAFTDEHIDIVREIADLVAVALSQMRYEQDLIVAKERAEEADRLKSSFLANMSHEIRTPLTAIMGFADIMQDELSGELRQFARHVHQSGQRLLDTLESVMQLSQLEAGQLMLRPVAADLMDELHRTADQYGAHAEARRIRLLVDEEVSELNGMWDIHAVRYVLDSLVDNAIKFTPSNGTVRLRAWPDGDRVHLRVADTGIGIEHDALDRVFEPFVQESEGLSRSHEGSGLGLSIVRRLVDLMQGGIELKSQKGHGTTVTITLPILTNGKMTEAGQ